MNLFEALYSFLKFAIDLIKSVLSAAASLFEEVPKIIDFLNKLPMFLPGFVVPFFLAGIFGTIILMILGRRT